MRRLEQILPAVSTADLKDYLLARQTMSLVDPLPEQRWELGRERMREQQLFPFELKISKHLENTRQLEQLHEMNRETIKTALGSIVDLKQEDPKTFHLYVDRIKESRSAQSLTQNILGQSP